MPGKPTKYRSRSAVVTWLVSHKEYVATRTAPELAYELKVRLEYIYELCKTHEIPYLSRKQKAVMPPWKSWALMAKRLGYPDEAFMLDTFSDSPAELLHLLNSEFELELTREDIELRFKNHAVPHFWSETPSGISVDKKVRYCLTCGKRLPGNYRYRHDECQKPNINEDFMYMDL